MGLAGFRQLGTPVQLPNISALSGFVPSGTAGFVVPLPTCDPNFVDAASPYGNWMQLVENGSVQYNRSQSLFQVLTSGGMTNGRGYYLMYSATRPSRLPSGQHRPVSFGLTCQRPRNQRMEPSEQPLPFAFALGISATYHGRGCHRQNLGDLGAYMGTFQRSGSEHGRRTERGDRPGVCARFHRGGIGTVCGRQRRPKRCSAHVPVCRGRQPYAEHRRASGRFCRPQQNTLHSRSHGWVGRLVRLPK